MHASHESQSSANFRSLYPPSVHQFRQLPNNNSTPMKSQQTEISFGKCTNQFFTLESTPAVDFSSYSPSPAISSSSTKCDFSPPQWSHSFISDPHYSSAYGSPLSGQSNGGDHDNKLMHSLSMLRNKLLGPESETEDSDFFNGGGVPEPSYFTKYNRIVEMAPQMDLTQLLISCAEIMSESDLLSSSERQFAISAAEALMDVLEKNVSVYGEPMQRLGAYMLEGLRARLLSSGSTIYKKLKCNNEPTSTELLSYMQVLYQMSPHYKFAYASSNVIISEAMENEGRIHIIDFQIAQGSQWIAFIQAISRRPGGPPHVRITGIDDSQSAHARGGGLQLVGQRLAQAAASWGVPFEFNAAAVSASQVHLENLQIRSGEALAVNFPYVLHHVPDESVTTTNHRDRLLRLVKGLSPKVVTLLEQESNTNTGTFFQRFCETLDYYSAMFDSIDDARKRDDGQRTSAEEHCLARDVVNIIACEGADRLERHELFGKWRVRLAMAGYTHVQLSRSVSYAVADMLREYSSNYRIAEGNGALYLGWRNRALVTCSAWR